MDAYGSSPGGLSFLTFSTMNLMDPPGNWEIDGD